MALTARVSSATASGVPAAAGRVGSSVRTAGSPIEGLSQGSLVGTAAGEWQAFSHGDFGSQGDPQQQQQRDPRRDPVTPLVGRAASGFQANETHNSAEASGFTVLIADMIHGVGVYETNMKVVAGNYNLPGSVLNRLY